MAGTSNSNNDLASAEILWKSADTLRGQIDARKLGTMQTRTLRVLTPGRYVGVEAQEEDSEPFAEKYPRLLAELEECFGEGERLMAVVREKLKGVGDAG